MPTPLAHALGGLAAGALVSGTTTRTLTVGRRKVPVLVAWSLCGMLPDLDFLIGVHQGVTHSLGALLVVAIATQVLEPRRPVLWVAAAAAYGSHLVLDWLGSDTVAPIGIMALWPFDRGFYLSPYEWFLPVCRDFWLVTCWADLAQAVTWELIVLGPVVFAALLLCQFRRGRTH